jgi:transcription antitermination factor NusG
MEHNWYALWVKSRHEFIARDDLAGRGIETFLPAVTKVQQWRDRKKNVVFPIFPGYLFVSLGRSAQEFQRAIRTRGSVGLISLEPGHPTPVQPEEITALKAVVASGQPFDVYPHFQTGVRVKIRRGPLQGAEGVLAKKDERDVFFVNVEILGRSIGLRISANDIEQAS